MKRINVSAGACLVAVSFSVLGCGDVPSLSEEAASEREAITGGTLVPSNFVPLSSAVRFEFINAFGSSFCSGQKVASNLYWTAGHCVDDVKVGDTVKVTNNLSGSFTGTSSYTRRVNTVATHPSLLNAYKMLPLGKFPANYDVGRLTFTETTPNIPSYATHETAWIGSDQLLILAGYGCDDANSANSGKKQWASFILENQTEAAAVGKDAAYYTHNMIDVSSTQQGCSGDSGGPAWTFNGTTYKTAGIAVHGGFGYTGFARFANVRNWLAIASHNDFSVGFQGFIFNHYTGRCVSPATSGHVERDCDGRNQNSDTQSWKLATSGVAGTFYIVNGSSGKCLDLDTTVSGAKLVERTCLPTSQSTNTQRWRFDATIDSAYRRLVNAQTGPCTEVSSPSSTSSVLVSKSCSTADPSWRYQAWVMTR
jgi:hypothetical protein